MAGIIEEIGKGVSKHDFGEEVYGMVGGIAGVTGNICLTYFEIHIKPIVSCRNPMALLCEFGLYNNSNHEI
jgi:hypothetical protein